MERTKAKKIHTLLKKQKGMIKDHYSTTPFKEPIMILMRRDRKAEFYEHATQGKFEFMHSDGQERYILLNPKFQQTFNYGDNIFRGYICHEDFPTPLPEDPIVTSEMMNIEIDKVLNDMKMWKAKEWEAKGTYWWKIGAGIAVIILAWAMFKLLIPSIADEPAVQAINQAGQNITILG